MFILTSAITEFGSAMTCSRNTFCKRATALSIYARASLTSVNGKNREVRKTKESPTIIIAVTETTRLLSNP